MAIGILGGIVLIILVAFIVIVLFVARQRTEVDVTAPVHTPVPVTPTPLPEITPVIKVPELVAPSVNVEELKETDVYTFLQGPVAWSTKTDWSGSWCNMILGGQSFGIFGCGLCDLANIYSTLTPYDCSPVDMFYFAQEASKYHPVSNYGAIDWPFLRDTLKATGIDSQLRKKDRTYEEFRQAIAGGLSAIALVSSENSGVYWPYTTGHYVNIWMYDGETDTVFLGDSGNPDHNRQRIPLQYVYDSLRTASNYQYLLVTGVSPSGNTWKHDGIDIEWTKPAYYK